MESYLAVYEISDYGVVGLQRRQRQRERWVAVWRESRQGPVPDICSVLSAQRPLDSAKCGEMPCC